MALYFFPSLFFFSSSLTKYLVFNIFYVYVFYVQSTYKIYSKQYMSSVSFVPCGVLFYLLFIFNIFVTSELMYIVVIMGGNQVLYFWSQKKKHFDVFDLQDEWTNEKIKENVETFLAALFYLNRLAVDVGNLNKKEIYLDEMILDPDDDFDDTDDKAPETPLCRIITKSICAYSIYQKMVYTVTDGKIKTPLHVMTGQSVYSRCHSHSTIISLNKIGVSTSYHDVQRDRALLALFAIKKSQDNSTPILSLF